MTTVCGEDVEQIKVCEWLRNKTDLPFYAIANQRSTSPQYGNLLKRMGVTKGVPDLCIYRRTKEFHGTYIELKTTKGRLSPEQQFFLDRATKEGYFAACAWGAESAIEIIKQVYSIP